MKKSPNQSWQLTVLLFIAFTFGLSACQKLVETEHDTLRILSIGHSFSNDSMEHLPALLENLGIKNVELARLYFPSCSLEHHLHCYNTNEAIYTFYHSKAGENKWIEISNVSLQYALKINEWDIITLQQDPGSSGIYSSYKPYLESLIKSIHKVQPSAKFVWHMTWAFSTDSTHPDYPRYDNNQQKMYNAINWCAQQVLAEYSSIIKIIPSGTTIQSLRESIINNPPKDLTRDGFHLDFGAGRYAAACTWYESLIEPFTHISIMNNTLRLDIGEINVTDNNAPYILQAAKQAVKKPFEVHPIEISTTK
ncbi:MAG: DUF4886 domain-containing protein [Alistipes sp.]|nr:DUF4886 domain-containing protein [Alistipes sp.]